MHIFHKWSQWEVISDKKVYYTTIIGGSGILREIIQSRKCSICGLVQYKTTDI